MLNIVAIIILISGNFQISKFIISDGITFFQIRDDMIFLDFSFYFYFTCYFILFHYLTRDKACSCYIAIDYDGLSPLPGSARSVSVKLILVQDPGGHPPRHYLSFERERERELESLLGT